MDSQLEISKIKQKLAERKTLRIRQQLSSLRRVHKNCSHSKLFTAVNIKASKIPGLFKFYTGFNFLAFISLFNCLVPSPDTLPFKWPRNLPSLARLTPVDQFFMVLCRLRHGFPFKDLACRFTVSHQDLSVIFSTWINFIYFTFGSIPIWPHRNVILSQMSTKFMQSFPKTMAIIDATEIKIQRPSSLVSQSESYSDYKSSNTLKALIAVDSRGSLMFISSLFSGNISDNRLTHDSGLLKLLHDLRNACYLKDGDDVMADKGFTNVLDFRAIGLNLTVPPFVKCDQMSPSDVIKTREIASHRIVVERAIARIKSFKILSRQVDICNLTNFNQMWFVCAFLTTFQQPLLQH